MLDSVIVFYSIYDPSDLFLIHRTESLYLYTINGETKSCVTIALPVVVVGSYGRMNYRINYFLGVDSVKSFNLLIASITQFRYVERV